METEAYDGGAIYQRAENGEPDGWTAKRWNKNIQARFARLLMALGQAFDGKIEGINLQESAIGVSHEFDNSFTPPIYVESLKTNLSYEPLSLAPPRPTPILYQVNGCHGRIKAI